jgi:uncharacterized protein CbrC (UPF0167 family)
MFLLEKMSTPGWDKELETLGDVEQELLKCLCSDCSEPYEYDGKKYALTVKELLSSLCGCEYRLYDEEEIRRLRI